MKIQRGWVLTTDLVIGARGEKYSQVQQPATAVLIKYPVCPRPSTQILKTWRKKYIYLSWKVCPESKMWTESLLMNPPRKLRRDNACVGKACRILATKEVTPLQQYSFLDCFRASCSANRNYKACLLVTRSHHIPMTSPAAKINCLLRVVQKCILAF